VTNPTERELIYDWNVGEDPPARPPRLVRVVDESGEDYLYHVSHFVFIELPEEVERVLVAA